MESKQNMHPKSWLEGVAERAKCDLKHVRAFVKKYNIIQSPALGNPKRVNIRGINFSGTKKGKHTDDFEFSFDDLGPGMWGLFSDGNGKGKSTVLEIVKWLFKGKVPSTLQAGVKSWIKYACLSFDIDEVAYKIRIEQNDDGLSGVIEKSRSNGEFASIVEFNNEEEMEEVISSFMLEQFELKEVASYRRGTDDLDIGTEVQHGWPALAAAMFIGTDYVAIFGDVVQSGLSSRILNMFMGLPWIPTSAALKALEGNLTRVASIESKHLDWAEQERSSRLADIAKELKKLRSERDGITRPSTNDKRFHELLDSYNQAYASAILSQRHLMDSEIIFGEVNAVAKDCEIKLRNFKEDKAANKVFKRLNPKCCPHCDRRITSDDLQREQSKNTCSVCDHEMLITDDSEELLAELEQAFNLSQSALKAQKEETRSKKSAYLSLHRIQADLKLQVEDYKTLLEGDKSIRIALDALEKEIYKLEILENEYIAASKGRSTMDVSRNSQVEDRQVESVDENVILRAAQKETESRYRGLQEDLLREVNKKMLEFCPKVGLGQYTSLVLNSGPTLKIDKDGSQTSYSKVSPGEKLRLKVIALVAMISVAESRGVGRHPGFLVIDSPAAQEVTKGDLQALMGGLKELCRDFPYLQIIIASTATPTLLDIIGESNRKYAKEESYLW